MSSMARAQIRLVLALSILCSCIGCDQATKCIATKTLKGAPAQSFAADIFRLEYVLNPGGFLSLGSNLPVRLRTSIFIGLGSCMSIALGLLLLLRPRMPIVLFIATAFVL